MEAQARPARERADYRGGCFLGRDPTAAAAACRFRGPAGRIELMLAPTARRPAAAWCLSSATRVHGIALAALDGRCVLVAGAERAGDGVLLVLDPAGSRIAWTVPIPHGAVRAVAALAAPSAVPQRPEPTEDHTVQRLPHLHAPVAVGTDRGHVLLLDLAAARGGGGGGGARGLHLLLPEADGAKTSVTCLAECAQFALLAAGYASGSYGIWSLRSGALLWRGQDGAAAQLGSVTHMLFAIPPDDWPYMQLWIAYSSRASDAEDANLGQHATLAMANVELAVHGALPVAAEEEVYVKQCHPLTLLRLDDIGWRSDARSSTRLVSLRAVGTADEPMVAFVWCVADAERCARAACYAGLFAINRYYSAQCPPILADDPTSAPFLFLYAATGELLLERCDDLLDAVMVLPPAQLGPGARIKCLLRDRMTVCALHPMHDGAAMDALPWEQLWTDVAGLHALCHQAGRLATPQQRSAIEQSYDILDWLLEDGHVALLQHCLAAVPHAKLAVASAWVQRAFRERKSALDECLRRLLLDQPMPFNVQDRIRTSTELLQLSRHFDSLAAAAETLMAQQLSGGDAGRIQQLRAQCSLVREYTDVVVWFVLHELLPTAPAAVLHDNTAADVQRYATGAPELTGRRFSYDLRHLAQKWSGLRAERSAALAAYTVGLDATIAEPLRAALTSEPVLFADMLVRRVADVGACVSFPPPTIVALLDWFYAPSDSSVALHAKHSLLHYCLCALGASQVVLHDHARTFDLSPQHAAQLQTCCALDVGQPALPLSALLPHADGHNMSLMIRMLLASGHEKLAVGLLTLQDGTECSLPDLSLRLIVLIRRGLVSLAFDMLHRTVVRDADRAQVLRVFFALCIAAGRRSALLTLPMSRQDDAVLVEQLHDGAARNDGAAAELLIMFLLHRARYIEATVRNGEMSPAAAHGAAQEQRDRLRNSIVQACLPLLPATQCDLTQAAGAFPLQAAPCGVTLSAVCFGAHGQSGLPSQPMAMLLAVMECSRQAQGRTAAPPACAGIPWNGAFVGPPATPMIGTQPAPAMPDRRRSSAPLQPPHMLQPYGESGARSRWLSPLATPCRPAMPAGSVHRRSIMATSSVLRDAPTGTAARPSVMKKKRARFQFESPEPQQTDVAMSPPVMERSKHARVVTPIRPKRPRATGGPTGSSDVAPATMVSSDGAPHRRATASPVPEGAEEDSMRRPSASAPAADVRQRTPSPGAPGTLRRSGMGTMAAASPGLSPATVADVSVAPISETPTAYRAVHDSPPAAARSRSADASLDLDHAQSSAGARLVVTSPRRQLRRQVPAVAVAAATSSPPSPSSPPVVTTAPSQELATRTHATKQPALKRTRSTEQRSRARDRRAPSARNRTPLSKAADRPDDRSTPVATPTSPVCASTTALSPSDTVSEPARRRRVNVSTRSADTAVTVAAGDRAGAPTASPLATEAQPKDVSAAETAKRPEKQHHQQRPAVASDRADGRPQRTSVPVAAAQLAVSTPADNKPPARKSARRNQDTTAPPSAAPSPTLRAARRTKQPALRRAAPSRRTPAVRRPATRRTRVAAGADDRIVPAAAAPASRSPVMSAETLPPPARRPATRSATQRL